MPLSTLLADRTRALIAAAKAGRFDSPELRLVRPLLELQARWSALPASRRMARRAHPHARRPRPLLLRLRGPPRAPRARHAVRLPALARAAAHVQHDRQRLRLRPARAGARRHLAGRPRPAARRGGRGGRHPRRPQRGRARPSPVSRDRPGGGPRLSGLPRSGRSRAASCRRRRACSTTCSPNTTPATRCCARPRARCSSASWRPRASRTGSRACGAAGCCSRQPARPTPFSFPLMVEMFREKLSSEALEARVARMVGELEAAAGVRG